MPFLLDTQVIIWFIEGNTSLPVHIKALIADPGNAIYVSSTSLFELVIKQKIGKLAIKRGLNGLIADLAEEQISVLTIENKYLLAYDHLPLIADHRDPFDRLILATAMAEEWPVISSDHKFGWYADYVAVIW